VFFSSKSSLFHNSNVFGSCIIHILYTGSAKIKQNNSGAKRLNCCKGTVCHGTELFLKRGLEGYCIDCVSYAFQLLDRFLYETRGTRCVICISIVCYASFTYVYRLACQWVPYLLYAARPSGDEGCSCAATNVSCDCVVTVEGLRFQVLRVENVTL